MVLVHEVNWGLLCSYATLDLRWWQSYHILVSLSFKLGNNRQKRQQTPLTSEDVLIIEPLVEDQGRLQVSFVVGGEGGQSTLISRSVLSSLLEAKGQQLAADLSAAVCAIYV